MLTAMSELIKVHDPKKPGDYLLVNKSQLSGYKLFGDLSSEEPVSTSVEKPADKAPAKPVTKKRATNRPK